MKNMAALKVALLQIQDDQQSKVIIWLLNSIIGSYFFTSHTRSPSLSSYSSYLRYMYYVDELIL